MITSPNNDISKNSPTTKPFEAVQVINIAEMKKPKGDPSVTLWHNQLWFWLTVGGVVGVVLVIMAITSGNLKILLLVPLGPCLAIIFWAIKVNVKKLGKEDVFSKK